MIALYLHCYDNVILVIIKLLTAQTYVYLLHVAIVTVAYLAQNYIDYAATHLHAP